MPDLRPLKLQDLAPFEALGTISKELGVDFTLFGGAAARAAMYSFYRPDHDLDLFDLAPFSSDIDLQHSGDEEKTPEIMQAITEHVPFASWCRWALLDKETAALADANRARSTFVPLRSITFRTDTATTLPDTALSDLKDRRVSFDRNPEFASSDFALQGRDLEIFGLLMALNVLADLKDISGDGELRNHSLAMRWLHAPETQAQLAHVSDARPLVARLWHLLGSQIARTELSELTIEFTRLVSKLDVMQHFNVDLQAAIEDERALTVSKLTSADEFRVSELSPELLTGNEAKDALRKVLPEIDLSDNVPVTTSGHASPRIDPAFELVAFVPTLNVTAHKRKKGEEDEAKAERKQFDSVYFSGSGEEFFHIAWKPGQLSKVSRSGKGLTACVLPQRRSQIAEFKVGVAVGGVFQDGRSWVRIDVGDAIDRGSSPRDTPVSLLILQARDEQH